MGDRIFVYGEGVLQEHPVAKRAEVKAFVELHNRNNVGELRIFVGERFPPPGQKLEGGTLRALTDRERWEIGELDLPANKKFSEGKIVDKTPADLAADGIISLEQLRALMIAKVNQQFEDAHQAIKTRYTEMNRQGWLRKAEQARLLLSYPAANRAAMLNTIPYLVAEANVRFSEDPDEVSRASTLATLVLEKEALFEVFNGHCNGVLGSAIAEIYAAETVEAISAIPENTDFPDFNTYGDQQ